MKITIVLGAFFPVPPVMGGAVEKAWFALGQEFARCGHEVTMISRAIPAFQREEDVDGIKHIRVRGFDTPRSLVWLKILDLIYSIRATSILPQGDVIVTNTFWLPILLRRSEEGKIYVHVARYPKGQMRFYGKAARLQTPSNSVARAIENEAPQLKNRIEVIPYPCPRSREAPIPTLQRDKAILFVGRIHPEKGVHLLVKAFADLPRDISNEWTLSIVGPAEEGLGGGGKNYTDQLRQLATQVKNRIFFRGPVFESAALEQYFLSARLFVYPSLAERGESFGLAPLEAMAHRCGVMVSDLECFADFVREGDTGFVFDHRSEDPALSLREKLMRVIVDQALLARVAESGYQKSADYSLTRVADQFLHDFSLLLNQPNAAGTSR